jgi:protein TonB
MGPMSQPSPVFVADAALRIERPQARSRALARALAAVFALALEGGVFALIWFERNPVPPPQPQEIPVEIIVEPPPPPPPQPQPDLKTEQDYEKPATDAPREGKSDHDDEHVAEKETPAKAPPPPPPAPPSPSPEPTPSPQASAPEAPLEKDAEIPAAPTPQPTQPPAPPPKPSVLAALPKTFDSVPDVDFGGAAIKSPVTGGNAKSTYLSTLYGLIVPRLHVPALAHAYGRRLTGAIALQVDGSGRLAMRFVAEASGSPELDEAAMKAVAEASREFPPPPRHAPMGMKFTYTVE